MRQIVAGLLQSQQMSGRCTSLSDRVRIMWDEIRRPGASKAEALDKTFIKAGMDETRDCKKVGFLFHLNR